MSEGTVVFSKIAATPTETAWSQAYSAGKLFTVLSLKGEPGEEKTLKEIGKSILDSLETEFFSLEEKTLESVKGAITEAAKAVPENLEVSFVTTVVSGNVLYSYILGKGTVFIKRGDKFGYVLESLEDSREISSASGFLQNTDLVILATEGFVKTVSKDQLSSSFDSLVPAEIAENLAPTIHESEEAGAASIILSYKEEAEAHEAIAVEEEKEEKSEKIDTISTDAGLEKANEVSESKKISFLSFLIPKRLTHSKKIYLTIAVLILVVLIASVLLGIKKQNDAKIEAAFDAVYPQAQKKFDDGESLKDLNKSLAMDSFNQAKTILTDAKSKFPSDSTQEKQIITLLAKINDEIAANPTPTSLDKTKIMIAVQNGSGVEGAAGKVSDYLKGLGYNVSGTSNADNYNYTGVTIKVKSSASTYLDGLKADLSKNYTVSSASADLSSGSPTDAVVIIGK